MASKKHKFEVTERNIVDIRTREPWVNVEYEDEPEDTSKFSIPLWVYILIVIYLLT